MVPDFGQSAPIAGPDLEAELRTREELRESRRLLATLLDNLPGMAYRCRNDRGWTMEFVSEGSRALTGYAPAELIGTQGITFGDLIVEADRDRVWRDVQAALAARQPFQVTYRLRRRDGTMAWLWERGQGVFSAEGGAEAIEGFITDITAQRSAEAALRASEEKFEKAFFASPDAISVHELKGGCFVDVNPGMVRLFGYTREELLGRAPADLGIWVVPAERVAFLEALVRDGSVRNQEVSVRLKDGRIRRCELSAELMDIGGKSHNVTVLRDVTESREIEQTLRESQEKFAKAFRVSPDSMAIADAETNQYLEINEGFERLFGYSRAEVIGKSPVDLRILVDPNDGPRLAALLLAEGRVRDAEVVVLTKSGERRTILHNLESIQVGGRRCLLCVSRDISASKRAGQALRDSEAKFATAFRASPMALTIVELANGRIIEVNSAFERISGYLREEALGRTTLELGLWGPEDRAVHVAALQRDGFVRGKVLTFRGRGGRELHMRSNAEIITVEGVRCILTVLEDVSEQRRAELHQAALEAQLRQNQKLEALGTLAGGIAHDFNNILTAIVVNQELALMDIHDSAEVRQRLAEIGLASNRAKELVRQILTFSRHQQHERLRQQLQMTVHEALSLVRASLPATIEIIQELAPEAPAVLADAGQVHQIVMNLCTNAAHAMRDKPGCLAVRLHAQVLDAAACHDRHPLKPGPHTVLTVTDTGHGMPPEVMARIFEPFFTTKGPGEGTGLGLPMVHGIMRDHEGAIFVRSQPGVGTTFELFFPAATAPAAALPVFDEPILRGHGESVLVVDDEAAICAAVGAMLGKLGYRVETFCDAQEGLARFRAEPQAFDLVLTDRTMPRLTGPELLAAVRQLRPTLPALVMSGLNGPDAGPAAGYGVVDKPIDISLLSRVVRHALDAARRA